MNRVGLDTDILVHYFVALKEKGAEERAQMIRAIINSGAFDIRIPTPVLTETSAFLDSSPRGDQAILDLVSQSTGIRPLQYDVQSARIGGMFHGEAVRRLKKKGARQCLKVDAMIVACAARHGCDTLCTQNTEDFQKLTELMRQSTEAAGIGRLPPQFNSRLRIVSLGELYGEFIRRTDAPDLRQETLSFGSEPE